MSQQTKDRTLLRRVIDAVLDRQENSYPPMAAHATATATQSSMLGSKSEPDVEKGKPWHAMTSNPDTLIPPNDKLLIFRSLTGIDSVPVLTHGGHLLRSAPNIGIYTRVVNNETNAAQAYRVFNYLINTCLSVQIVVAAALTALGAASGPHAAITAFGAINTVVAGVLTYLRGSGLPDRLKSYQNKWKHIREYIEQREREFCLVGCDLDVQEEVFIVESMYQSLKSEMETARSSGDTKTQQPDDPRIRRSLLPKNHELSGQRPSTTPATRSEVVNPPDHHEPVSPVTIPEATLEKH